MKRTRLGDTETEPFDPSGYKNAEHLPRLRAAHRNILRVIERHVAKGLTDAGELLDGEKLSGPIERRLKAVQGRNQLDAISAKCRDNINDYVGAVHERMDFLCIEDATLFSRRMTAIVEKYLQPFGEMEKTLSERQKASDEDSSDDDHVDPDSDFDDAEVPLDRLLRRHAT